MGIMIYSLLWVMQELYHQPYFLTVNWSSIFSVGTKDDRSNVNPESPIIRFRECV